MHVAPCNCKRASVLQCGRCNHTTSRPTGTYACACACTQAMQEAMQRPEVQQQMAQMEAMMRNDALQKRMAELKNDPEMKEMFEEIQKGGMGALMK